MTDWRRTPKEMRLTALRLVDGAWERCEYEELKPGDLFRAVEPDGSFIHPLADKNNQVVAIVREPPVRALAEDGMQGHGFGVLIDIYESLDEAIKARAN